MVWSIRHSNGSSSGGAVRTYSRLLVALSIWAVCAAAGAAERLDLDLKQSSHEERADCSLVDACSQESCSQGCCSQDDDFKPWSFTFTQTVDYVTNLALPITLTPANTVFSPFQDDMQFQTTARLQRTWRRDDETFAAAYGFYQSLHPEVHELDLLSNTVYLTYSRQVNSDLVIGADASYAYYLLDGVSFVSQNQAGVSAQRRVNDRWDAKAQLDYAYLNFRGSEALNSHNYSGQLETVRYVNDARTDYWGAGYGAAYSDANNEGFSYLLNNVFLTGRFALGQEEKLVFQPLASYGFYNFQAADPLQVGTVRRDELFTAGGSLSRTLSDRWSVFGSYTYLNSDSNVIRQLYHQNVISLGITGVW